MDVKNLFEGTPITKTKSILPETNLPILNRADREPSFKIEKSHF